MKTLSGGCHCGAIRFDVGFDDDPIYDCNCSMCTKKGFLHLIVPPDRFHLRRGEDSLAVYRFNTKVARHTFCRVCGIHPFYTPRSHPDHIDVNLRCLDDVELADFSIRAFDGRHWEDNIDAIR